MKKRMIITAALCLTILASAQPKLEEKMWPCAFQADGQVTHYSFKNGCIPVCAIPNATAINNQSLKTETFVLSWVPVYTSRNINEFVKITISDFKAEVIDSSTCNIFGEESKVLVLKRENEYFLYIYQNNQNFQDMFVARLKDFSHVNSTIFILSSSMQMANIFNPIQKKVEFETASLDLIFHDSSDLFMIDVFRF